MTVSNTLNTIVFLVCPLLVANCPGISRTMVDNLSSKNRVFVLEIDQINSLTFEIH